MEASKALAERLPDLLADVLTLALSDVNTFLLSSNKINFFRSGSQYMANFLRALLAIASRVYLCEALLISFSKKGLSSSLAERKVA